MRHAGQAAAGVPVDASGDQGHGGDAAGAQRLRLTPHAEFGDPIGEAEFAALLSSFAPFDRTRRVAVAVSGGGDSMALALLLSRWGDPVAAIVDHGLRAESAAEAATAAARLAAIGVPATILRAELLPGATPERARIARYRLLLEFCQQAGRPDLFLAHHAHDQAETVRMRQAHRSGPAGLAGIAPVEWRAEARLLRPLLGIAPGRLRATLREVGLDWIDDPSNTDPRFERARFRAELTDTARLDACSAAADAAQTRHEAECRDATWLAGIDLRPEGFAIVPGSLSASSLSALLWTLSGRRHPPPSTALVRGLAARSVHSVVIRPAGRLGPGTLLCREPAAVAPPVTARPGVIWDGRFRLSGAVLPGLTLGALGRDAAALRRHSPLPAIVLATLPALRRGDDLVAVPHLRFPAEAACRNLRLDYWPGRPVAPAPFGLAEVHPCWRQGM